LNVEIYGNKRMAQAGQGSGTGLTTREALRIRANGMRGKGPYRVDYDSKGNLDVRDKQGKFVNHVAMPSYRSTTEEELEEMFEARAVAIQEAEQTIETLMPELRDMITRYKAIGAGEEGAAEEPVALSDILLKNQELQQAYARYTIAMSPERETIDIGKQDMKHVYLYQSVDDKKTEFPMKRYYTRRLPLEEFLVRSAPPEPEEEAITPAARAQATMTVPGERYTIFAKPEDANGGLAPDAPVNFVWNGNAYTSVRQAIEAEKARAAGNAGLVQQILRAKTSLQAKTLGAKAEAKGAGGAGGGGMTIRQDVLTDIVRASFAGNQARAATLRATGQSTLVYADEGERVLGIGRGPNHAQRAQWQGENLFGRALTAVRQTLTAAAASAAIPFEEGAGAASGGAGPGGSGALSDATQKAVAGAVIARRKAPTFVTKAPTTGAAPPPPSGTGGGGGAAAASFNPFD
jgi:ribA/ribD-fused uncharacterized protein